MVNDQYVRYTFTFLITIPNLFIEQYSVAKREQLPMRASAFGGIIPIYETNVKNLDVCFVMATTLLNYKASQLVPRYFLVKITFSKNYWEQKLTNWIQKKIKYPELPEPTMAQYFNIFQN